MKLYLFDHCPFCVKAMMAAGYGQVPVDYVYLENDDVAARERMVGFNAVPILEHQPEQFMAESTDIVALLIDQNEQSLASASHQAQIQQWLSQYQLACWGLLFPRNAQLPLPEFATPQAIRYFTLNKSALLNCDFAHALADTPHYLAQMSDAMAALSWLTRPSERSDTRLSWDDIALFPTLRNLTMVKGLRFPAHIIAYVDEVSELTRVPLYRHMAC